MQLKKRGPFGGDSGGAKFRADFSAVLASHEVIREIHRGHSCGDFVLEQRRPGKGPYLRFDVVLRRNAKTLSTKPKEYPLLAALYEHDPNASKNEIHVHAGKDSCTTMHRDPINDGIRAIMKPSGSTEFRDAQTFSAALVDAYYEDEHRSFGGVAGDSTGLGCYDPSTNSFAPTNQRTYHGAAAAGHVTVSHVVHDTDATEIIPMIQGLTAVWKELVEMTRALPVSSVTTRRTRRSSSSSPDLSTEEEITTCLTQFIPTLPASYQAALAKKGGRASGKKTSADAEAVADLSATDEQLDRWLARQAGSVKAGRRLGKQVSADAAAVADLSATDEQLDRFLAQQAGFHDMDAAIEAIRFGKPTPEQVALHQKQQASNIRKRDETIKSIPGVSKVPMAEGILCKCSKEDCVLSSDEANPLICNTKIDSKLIPNYEERMEVTFPHEPKVREHLPHAGKTFVYPTITAASDDVGIARGNLSSKTKDGLYAPSRGSLGGFVFERVGRPDYPPLVWLTFQCPNCKCVLLPKEIPPHCEEDEYILLNFHAYSSKIKRRSDHRLSG